jgi:type II secretory pathway pseudopilin PulG
MRVGEARHHQRGFTYLWVMAALAVLGVALAAVGTHWAHERQREREQDLIRIGVAYARAIASYRASAPGSVALAPRRLEHLVLDDRFPRARRHLRQLYADPVAPEQGWGLITDAEGRIVGVHSSSEKAPLKHVAFEVEGIALPAAQRYADWKFIIKEGKP